MPNYDSFKPDIWTEATLANWRKALASAGIVTDRSAIVRTEGKTVYFPRAGSATAQTYTGSPLTFGELATSEVALNLNRNKVVALYVNDVDEVQSSPSVIDTLVQAGVIANAEAVDAEIMALTGGTAGDVDVDLTAGEDLAEAFIEAGQNLNSNSVPQLGRFAVVSPKMHSALIKSDAFVKATELGDSIRVSGTVGRVYGFDVLLSNQAPEAAGVRTALYGMAGAIAYAEQINESELFRPAEHPRTLVRTIVDYGHTVLRPEALGAFNVTE